MKKLLCLFLCLLLPLGALAEEIAPLSMEDATLVIGDTVYTLDDDPAALIAALEALTGGPLAMTESVSCMFSGMDREYENEAVLVGTYPIGKNGGDMIESVIIYTDALATARGATVGMTTDDIRALYGEPYFIDWNELLYYLTEDANSPDEFGPGIYFGFDLDTGEIIYLMLRMGRTA